MQEINEKDFTSLRALYGKKMSKLDFINRATLTVK